MGTRFQSAVAASFAAARVFGLAVAGSACLLVLGPVACSSDEPGHTKTVTKTTTDTPMEKTTTTETHEKDTKVYPR